MFAKSAVAVALLAGFAVAATSDNSTIDPSTVTLTTRSQWCQGEQNTCPILCGGASATTSNDCDPTTLNYTCTCSNGSAPGLQYYTTTMPTFICEQIYQNCIVTGQNDAAAQKLCTTAEANNCGHLDPSKYVAPASSSSSSAATTATSASAAGQASGTATSTSVSKAAAATMAVMAREYGTGLLAAGAAAAFGLML
ncbi:hypothetical protein G7Y89_g5675 [Cudoniella acicularis]|uniref:DUF7707 domain-containing protein n=1 Tax=Cudoniella acicularis TaxID=354080 RepID=A0A8H4RM15_9HELO|nr:hypothetical protein G7Y89_g5675 [Cudoniella acicularis]